MKHLKYFTEAVQQVDADKKAKLIGYLTHNSRFHAGKETSELNLENVIYQGLIRGKYDTSKAHGGREFVSKNSAGFKGIVQYLLDYKGGKQDTQLEWVGFSFNKQQRQKADGKTYNYYVTFERTPRNIAEVMRNLYAFHDALERFAQDNRAAISYKFGANLSHFFEDADHLKVYFYDPQLSQPVSRMVEAWFSAKGIQLEARNYTHGVDVEGGGSWGTIVAGKVAGMLTDLMRKHGDQYTGAQYFDWLIKAVNAKFSF